MSGILGEKSEAHPGDLGYRGPTQSWQLGYDQARKLARISDEPRTVFVEGSGASGGSGDNPGDTVHRGLWRNMRDSAFRIVSVAPATGILSIGEGYVWGFTSGLKVAANATVNASGGTEAAPLFVYASGAVTDLTGTIASTAVVLASLPFGQENVWVFPIYRVYAKDGLLRIMPVMYCPNLRTYYGP